MSLRRPRYSLKNASAKAKQDVAAEPVKKSGIEKIHLIPELPFFFDYSEDKNKASQFRAEFAKKREKLKNYIGSKFGMNSHIIENQVDYVFQDPPLPAEWIPEHGVWNDDENDPDGIKNARRINQLKSFDDMKTEYIKNKPKIYNIIWSLCTTALHHKIRRDPEFDGYDLSQDPLPLWNRIVAINLGVGDANEVEGADLINRAAAVSAFGSVKQRRDESIGDFYQRYVDEQCALEAVGAPLGTDAEQAIDFLQKVDPIRFQELKTKLKNALTIDRVNKYPTSLVQAYGMCSGYKMVVNQHEYSADDGATVFAAIEAEAVKKYISQEKQKKAEKERAATEKTKKDDGGGKSNGYKGRRGKRDARGGSRSFDDNCWGCGKKLSEVSHSGIRDCPVALEAKKLLAAEGEETTMVTLSEELCMTCCNSELNQGLDSMAP
jgi:hypothetical protein